MLARLNPQGRFSALNLYPAQQGCYADGQVEAPSIVHELKEFLGVRCF